MSNTKNLPLKYAFSKGLFKISMSDMCSPTYAYFSNTHAISLVEFYVLTSNTVFIKEHVPQSDRRNVPTTFFIRNLQIVINK